LAFEYFLEEIAAYKQKDANDKNNKDNDKVFGVNSGFRKGCKKKRWQRQIHNDFFKLLNHAFFKNMKIPQEHPSYYQKDNG
jgi:hypothetical protein